MSDLLQKSQKRLKETGGRMTPQRRLILETLNTLECHPTAEDLFNLAQLRDPSLHLTTVYRTLRWLEQEGLISVRRFNEEHRQKRFDLAYPIEHYHFLCTLCKNVIEFDNLLVNAIKAQFELHSGAQVDVGSVTLYGVCPNCLKEQADA
jgi:Fe2+ or Zn2+ uptake regulation protein